MQGNPNAWPRLVGTETHARPSPSASSRDSPSAPAVPTLGGQDGSVCLLESVCGGGLRMSDKRGERGAPPPQLMENKLEELVAIFNPLD